MFYYYVWVRSNRYHSREPLTYSSEKKLAIGSIVLVELQKEIVSGFISGVSLKPKFKTKDIEETIENLVLPAHYLNLARWLMQYYPSAVGLITQQFLPNTFYKDIIDKEYSFDKESILKKPLALNDEQKNAVEETNEVGNYILHGITGSGKTRVYIELTRKSLDENKSAIILTPEISLTTQLANSFREYFGERVIVLHSQQSPKEKFESWYKCLIFGQPVVVIGPRSALFAPLKSLGLVVLDEAHETAYKQEQSPQYVTSLVASTLAKLTNAKLILGSATPLISDYYLALQKHRPIVKLGRLAQRFQASTDIKIELVDMKDKTLFNRSYLLSQKLIEAITETLDNNEQALLYLNRRGTARIILCDNCGWQALCPHCDIALTYHGDQHKLRCHSCNHQEPAPTSCPSCGNNNIIFKSAGTKAVAAELNKLFPGVNIKRFDTDNSKSESFISNYEEIRTGKINIIIGTQMIAKGLDLPKLSLVGVVLADTSLYLPDYTSQERTFQLINQVLGRIGRGHVKGRAIIQTYSPDNSTIKAALKKDYSAFYKEEIKNRKKYYFPPFCFMLKLTIKRASIASIEKVSVELKKQLEKNHKVIVEGPSPSFHEKVNSKYRWQLVVKSSQRSELLNIIDDLPANVSYDIDPMDLL
jgi:primosomal protein N' (replication factor Y)